MRLIVSLVLVLLLCTCAWAHDGMLALFTDETVSDCDAEVGQYGSVDMMLFYLRGDGPEMGKAWEFRLEKSSSDLVFGTPTWHPSVYVPTIGSLEDGISVASPECLGTGVDVVYLGTIPVAITGPAITYTITVVEDLNAVPDPGIFITLCEEGHPMYAVGGGEFVLNGECVPLEVPIAVEESSWGAIKSLYGK